MGGSLRPHGALDLTIRYSVLPIVFAQLVTDGRITPEELHGLAEDKLRYVRFASESKARKPL